jgi:hypothetical protein
LLAAGVVWFCAAPVHAADIGVEGKKLVIKDAVALNGKAKVIYKTKYHSPVDKGDGIDPAAIDAQLDVSYVAGSTSGSFLMPQGANWIVNNTRIAKYVNAAAPSGGGAKVATVKPNGKIVFSGKSLGDAPIDILNAGAPGPSGVLTVFTVNNDGETNRHCTLFTACVHRLLYAGAGAKLACGAGTAAACP